MMWLITVGVLVVWCVVYTYEYYEDKMSSEPGCAMMVLFIPLLVSPLVAVMVVAKILGVEPVRAAPFAVGALVCAGALWFVHVRWDARRDRVIERDRCVNVGGVNGDDLTVDEVMDFVRSQDARIVVDVRSSADASMFTVEELVSALDGEGVEYVEVPVLRVPEDVMLDVDSDPSVWKTVADGYREYVGSSIMAREAVAQMRVMAQSVYPQKLVVLMSGDVSYSYQFMVLRERLCAGERVFRLKTNSLLY
jgi:hypothetical protein